MKPKFRTPEADVYYSEREAYLRSIGAHVPKPISSEFPFLKERATGIVHPWSAAMAERDDLVVGCYNIDGSEDPTDRLSGYDPTALYMEKVLPLNSNEEQHSREHKHSESIPVVMSEEITAPVKKQQRVSKTKKKKEIVCEKVSPEVVKEVPVSDEEVPVSDEKTSPEVVKEVPVSEDVQPDNTETEEAELSDIEQMFKQI